MVIKSEPIMRDFIVRARRALWTFKQPLTKTPKLLGVPVSDLFVWRNSDVWQTFFELTDMSGLFLDHEKVSERYATLYFFDNEGVLFFEKRLDLICNQRQTIDLSLFLSNSKCKFGTFCVFHSHTPKVISDLGSFIAERGYVGYRYNDAPLRAYVHGNLDAICLLPDMKRQLLGSSSFLTREYWLQHELSDPAQYEIAMVNPSSRDQLIYCQLQSTRNGDKLETKEIKLRPGGAHVFPIKMGQSETARIIIGSHLVMARPLVYRFNNNRMDVFHG
jgi:hypothetical protein